MRCSTRIHQMAFNRESLQDKRATVARDVLFLLGALFWGWRHVGRHRLARVPPAPGWLQAGSKPLVPPQPLPFPDLTVVFHCSTWVYLLWVYLLLCPILPWSRQPGSGLWGRLMQAVPRVCSVCLCVAQPLLSLSICHTSPPALANNTRCW